MILRRSSTLVVGALAVIFGHLSMRSVAEKSSTKDRADSVDSNPIPENVPVPDVSGSRSSRFPSAEERLKVYMSNWYVPPCEGYDNGLFRYRYTNERPSQSEQPDQDKKKKEEEKKKKKGEWPVLIVEEAADMMNATSLSLDSIIEPDMIFYLDRETAIDCSHSVEEKQGKGSDPKYRSRVVMRKNMLMYCVDTVRTILSALDDMEWETMQFDEQLQQHQLEQPNSKQKTKTQRRLKEETKTQREITSPPTLLQFGDLKHSHVYGFINIPHIKKFRSAVAADGEIERVTSKECYDGPRDVLRTTHNTTNYQPIVWKLATSRHYRLLDKVYREDTPWEKKKDVAVFRGQLTGSRGNYERHLSDVDNCMNMRRCRLVYNHANSTLIHAKLTSTRNKVPDIMNGVHMVGSPVTIRTLLKYKAIIMLEGNDVASGLKWALASQSIVMMPAPKHTSWALEELLQPWVHYVPLNENATDVEEKMQWIIDNDDIARRISKRGTMWMEDLCLHPDSQEDDRWIQEEIVGRYHAHFAPSQ